MKTKIKRHSRSALAVVLTLCMLVSCMTVGLIATDAARIASDDEAVGAKADNENEAVGAAADSEAVGWNPKTDKLHLRIGSTWTDYYFSSAGVTTFTVASDNTTIEFELNFNGSVYKLDSSQSGFSADGIWGTSGEQRKAKLNASSTYTVKGVHADTYTVTLVGTPDSQNYQEVKIAGTHTSGGGSTPTTDWYVYGAHFGGWEGWSTSSITKLTLDDASGYYYADHTVNNTDTSAEKIDRFRVYADAGDDAGHYKPPTGVDQKLELNTHKSATKDGNWDASYFALDDFSSNTELRVWWDAEKKEAWVTYPKPYIASSLTLTPDKYTLTGIGETVTFTAAVDTPLKNDLTYKLYASDAPTTVIDSKTTTTGGSVTFTAIAPNALSKSYFATVEYTTTPADYNIVTSDTVAISNTNEEYKPSYTVTINVADADKALGTVTVKDDAATPQTAATTSSDITNSITVKEGHSVTITANVLPGNQFKGWTGTTETASSFTTAVYADINVTAAFAPYGFQIISSVHTPNGGNMKKMRQLSNGTFISVDEYTSEYWFKIYRNEDGYIGKTSGKNGWNLTDYGSYYKTNGDTQAAPVSWNDDDNHDWYDDYSFKWKKSSDKGYIVYDPATDKVWVTDNDGDYPTVEITAKNGTIRTQDNKEHTSDFGVTTVVAKDLSDNSTISATEAGAYGNRAVRYSLTGTQNSHGVQLTVKTVVNATQAAAGYYVKGFVVSGYEETFAVLTQEFKDEEETVTIDGQSVKKICEKTTYDDYDKIHGKESVESGRPWNEFTLVINDYITEPIEITPIYYIRETYSGDNVRFYVDSFAGEVKENWGGTLAVDVYGENSRPWGEYPGQPMINYNGRYMVDIPRKDIKGITLNNYVWDHVHSNLFYGTGGKTDSELGEAIKDHNYQTYDYNDFKYIRDKLTTLGKDEDIIFSFRYKRDASHDTKATSNLGTATYYIDTPNTNPDLDGDYRKGYSTITSAHEEMYQFEPLTDFYGNRVDVFGDLVDRESNATRSSYNPLRIVSNGYDLNKAGIFGTAWALYTPNSWTGTAGTYSLADVIGGQGRTAQDFQSESFLIDPQSEARVRFKYDHSIRDDTTLASTKYDDAIGSETILGYWQRKFREQNNNSTTYPTEIADLVGIPAEITYEYEVKDGRSNLTLDSLTGEGQIGYRSDGRWYYSSSDQLVKAHIIIEYAESKGGTYKRDYFQGNSVDFNQSGYDPSKNQGLSTGVKAYFDNDGTESREGRTFTNTKGYTVANGITDGDYTFDLRTEADAEGNYTFDGWYLLVDGKYTLVSRDENYDSEATNNDIYVARYYKTPNGNLTISHILNPDSTGEADCYTKIDILNSAGTAIDTNTFPETTSSVKVGSTIIKSNSTNKIRITLRTVPNDYSTFTKFQEMVSSTLSDLTAGTGNQLGLTATVSMSTSGPYTATITFPISKLFDSNGHQTLKATPFYSLVGNRGCKYSFTYQYVSRLYGTLKYTSQGNVDTKMFSNYFKWEDNALQFESNTKMRNFLAARAPYEDNFKEKITWNFDTCTTSMTTYTAATSTISLTNNFESTQAADNTIHVAFEFPYQINVTKTGGCDTAVAAATTTNEDYVDDKGTPVSFVQYIDPEDPEVVSYQPVLQRNIYNSSGVYQSSSKETAGEMRYLDWISLNTCHNSKEAKNDSIIDNEASFITAPQKVVVSVENTGGTVTVTQKSFLYWKVQRAIRNDYGNITGYTDFQKCYAKEFNLPIYQDCKITPVYGTDEELTAVEAARLTAVAANLSFLENSRNQWNNHGGDSGIFPSGKTYWENFGDRVYSDFVLSFDYKNQQLNTLTGQTHRAGLLIETVEANLDNGNTASSYYQTKYADSIAKSKSNAKTAVEGNKTAHSSTVGNYQFSYIDFSKLDPRNTIEYYYTFANVSMNIDNETAGTIIPTLHRNKVYRAFSFIIDEEGHATVSDPIYFTIYDIATVADGNTLD